MRSLFLTMSLSGTVVFLLYICLRPFSDSFCTARWKYIVLKMSLFFFLFPVSWFKFRLLDAVSFFVPVLRISAPMDRPLQLNTVYSVAVTNTSIIFSEKVKNILSVSFVIFVAASVGIMVLILKNKKLVHNLEKYAIKNIGEQNQLVISELLTKEAINSRKVRFYESEYIKTPMVLGLCHPFILLPENLHEEFAGENLRMILLHELFHIRHKDLWFRLLGVAALLLHWYNPVVWLLFFEICCVSEQCCDEDVIQSFNGQVWKKYGDIVIAMSTEISIQGVTDAAFYASVSMLGSSMQITKRRIEFIKKQNNRKSGILSKTISCFLTVLICMSAAVTTFAYEPAMIYASDDNGEESNLAESEMWFYPEGVEIPMYEKVLPYDFYFTDEEGNIRELSDDNTGRRSCVHNLVSGMTTRHFKNSKGGCKTENYNAKLCSLCSYVQKLNKYNAITHEVCPH